MSGQLHANITALQSMHRFGDLYERAIRQADSDLMTLEPLRGTVDAIGRHWYGMRLRVVSQKSGQQFYLHTGLIFLPQTRVGLMVEVDRKNNLNTYANLWEGLTPCELFEVNRDEEEYLKLFMPDATFDAMRGMPAPAQLACLTAFVQAACEAIVKTEDACGFALSYADLAAAYDLALALEQVLTACDNPLYRVRLNLADPDNFGQYASGYRYWLESPDGKVSLYAYFGAIYSYKKRPCGLFAEIDQPSNPEWFDAAARNLGDDPAYDYSRVEPKFIKLFLPASAMDRFRITEREEQMRILASFVDACNARLMEAAQKGR